MFDKTRSTFWAENRQMGGMASFSGQDVMNANPTVAQVLKIMAVISHNVIGLGNHVSALIWWAAIPPPPPATPSDWTQMALC